MQLVGDQSSTALHEVTPAAADLTAATNPDTLLHPEPTWERRLYLLAAVAFTLFYLAFHAAYFVPCHPGVDQNGYLIGGRMLAQHHSTRMDAINPDTGKVDPFLFVGEMWVGIDLGTDKQRFYPKYPIGLPALVAVCLKIGGVVHGPVLAYWINPVCTALAVFAAFLLARLITGSFAAFLAMAVMATNPVTINHANNPNSHASTLCFVTWGMYLLLRWWQHGNTLRAASPIRSALCISLAGFLLGYAATIRYTEGMLILPILCVILFSLRRQRQYCLEVALLLFWWLVPLIILASFNLAAMGHWTGYDPTNESSGFRWEYFSINWYTMLHQLHDIGLIFVFPLACAGLLMMFAWNWRIATVLALWIFPCLLLYTGYYWAPDWNTNTGYLRFFLTVFPALCLCAFWLLSRLHGAIRLPNPRLSKSFSTITAGILAAAAIGVSLRPAIAEIDQDQHSRLLSNDASRQILEALDHVHCPPRDAVLFTQDEWFLHHLQFVCDARLYNSTMFKEDWVRNLTNMDPAKPQVWDPGRRQALATYLDQRLQQRTNLPAGSLRGERLGTEMFALLSDERRAIIEAALNNHHRVFLITQNASAADFHRMADPRFFETKLISTWNCSAPRPTRDDPKPFERRQPNITVDRSHGQVVEVTAKPASDHH